MDILEFLAQHQSMTVIWKRCIQRSSMKKTVKSRQEKRMKERKEKENLHPHQRSALVTDYNNLDSVTYPRDIACVLNIVTWCAYLLAQGITLEDKIKGGDRLAVPLYAQRMVNDACCRVCLTV